MARRIYPRPDWANLTDTLSRWWLCTRHGHDWTTRSDPPACTDCGRIKRGAR